MAKNLTEKELVLLEQLGRHEFYKLRREKILETRINYPILLVEKFYRYLVHKLAVAITAVQYENKKSEQEQSVLVKQTAEKIHFFLFFFALAVCFYVWSYSFTLKLME